RTRPGRCLRLYTAQDFAARPAYESPEVQRLDLTEAALELRAAGVKDLSGFEWFEPPSTQALNAAETLLRKLNALDARGGLTAHGRRMLRLPLHPRLARVIVEAEARGVAPEACVVAALISERDIRANQIFDTGARPPRAASTHGDSDLLELFDLFREAERADFVTERLRRMNLDANAARAVDRVRRQLQRSIEAGGGKPESKAVELSSTREEALLICVLAGYPDRVARRRVRSSQTDETNMELQLAGGGSAQLAPESVVRRAEFLVAVEAGERRPTGRIGARSAKTLVRLASAIEPEWLLDLFTDDVGETTEVVWNAQLERAETVRRLTYQSLVLDESRRSESGSVEASRVLAEAACAKGLDAFIERAEVERFLARVAFVAATFPEASFSAPGDEELREAFVNLCENRSSFAELRAALKSGDLIKRLRGKLGAEGARLLSTMAPERVTLASGRGARVNYERGKPPWVASRLQDFFGVSEGPRVAGGRVAVVLHLLAPNGRPVQVTTDLAGFWSRHYQQARRELGRRYPRHAWPEDPLAR
ncbi:MAG: ATP-dependent helicase C-terminal domain-containing protein, partial [Pyrinomonadaceae bacterium]